MGSNPGLSLKSFSGLSFSSVSAALAFIIILPTKLLLMDRYYFVYNTWVNYYVRVEG